MRGSVVIGRVTAWDRPREKDGTWSSRLVVESEDDTGRVTLHVTTHRPEDHVWITHKGERVRADNVEWMDCANASTSHVTLLLNEPLPWPTFVDLPPRRVVGVQRESATSTRLFFEAEKGEEDALRCVDPAKRFHVGDTVALFNVKVSRTTTLITEHSSVKVCAPPQKKVKRSSPPPRPTERPRARRWECLMCGWLNYATHGSCRSCERSRRAGPVAPFDFRRHTAFCPHWQCRSCGHEEWVCRNRTTCWKCGQDRKNCSRKKR